MNPCWSLQKSHRHQELWLSFQGVNQTSKVYWSGEPNPFCVYQTWRQTWLFFQSKGFERFLASGRPLDAVTGCITTEFTTPVDAVKAQETALCGCPLERDLGASEIQAEAMFASVLLAVDNYTGLGAAAWRKTQLSITRTEGFHSQHQFFAG